MGDEAAKVEQARVASVKKAAEEARAKEASRRAAHAAGVKRAYSESLIVHGPVQK